MQISITGQHFSVSTALQEYVQKKLKRLERHFDQVTNVHVVLSKVEKAKMKADATVHVSGGNLFAEVTHQSMYAAIDTLADKLNRQIVKHKEKLSDHHRCEDGPQVPD